MSNMSVDKQDVFDIYSTKFVHGLEIMPYGNVWYEMRDAHNAFAVVVSDEIPNTLFLEKETGKHVEHIAIEKIRKFIQARNASSDQQLTVKIFMNVMPCNDITKSCCDELILLKKSITFQLNLEIIFASFYNIERPSCLRDHSCSYHTEWFRKNVSQADRKASEDGLRKLVAEGITLRTCTADDWDILAFEFGVDNPHSSKRAKEDARMAADLKAILEVGQLTSGRNVGFGDPDKEEDEEEEEEEEEDVEGDVLEEKQEEKKEMEKKKNKRKRKKEEEKVEDEEEKKRKKKKEEEEEDDEDDGVA